MKRFVGIISLLVIGISIPALADSFGFYFRNHGFGFGMQFHDYDYYDEYSPGFYDNTEIDFRMALDPYGYWDYMADFGGYVWIPAVPVTWAPYTYGSWTYTRYGWTWVSYEPWGWIPHHYGRWFFHPFYRWIWVPGDVYSPAWVTWGYYNGYYAWAPLPPQYVGFYAHYNPSYYGDRYYQYNYYDNDYYENHNYYNRSYHWYGRSNSYENSHERWIPNDAWVFVSQEQFMADDISSVRIDRSMAARMLQASSGSYGSSNFAQMKAAPSTRDVERYTRRKVETIPINEVTKATKSGSKIKIVHPKGVMESREKAVKPVYQKFEKVPKIEKRPLPKPDNPQYRKLNESIKKEPVGSKNDHGKPAMKENKTAPVTTRDQDRSSTMKQSGPPPTQKQTQQTQPKVHTQPNTKQEKMQPAKNQPQQNQYKPQSARPGVKTQPSEPKVKSQPAEPKVKTQPKSPPKNQQTMSPKNPPDAPVSPGNKGKVSDESAPKKKAGKKKADITEPTPVPDKKKQTQPLN